MTTLCRGGRDVGNPFATRHVRPGSIPALDAEGRPLDIDAQLAALAKCGGSAALVGPHGSGKTTLLWQLAAAIEAGDGRVERLRLRGGRDCAALVLAIARCGGGGTVCIDSWETLGWVWMGILVAFSRLTGTRLLVTAHRSGPLPTLRFCSTSASLLRAIVSRLPGGRFGTPVVAQADIDRAFHSAAGDVREALFLLYDRFEERVRSSDG